MIAIAVLRFTLLVQEKPMPMSTIVPDDDDIQTGRA